MARGEFCRRLGNLPSGGNFSNLRSWMTGRCYPIKVVIDNMLDVTGLTYEELWADHIVEPKRKKHIEDLSDGALD